MARYGRYDLVSTAARLASNDGAILGESKLQLVGGLGFPDSIHLKLESQAVRNPSAGDASLDAVRFGEHRSQFSAFCVAPAGVRAHRIVAVTEPDPLIAAEGNNLGELVDCGLVGRTHVPFGGSLCVPDGLVEKQRYFLHHRDFLLIDGSLWPECEVASWDYSH